MNRPILPFVLLALLPGFAWGQGGLVAKHKHDARRAHEPVVRLEAVDHSFSIVVPYEWLPFTGDSPEAVARMKSLEDEPTAQEALQKLKSGIYQIFATSLLDGLKEKPVGATFNVSALPASPFEFTEDGIEEFKGGFSANPRIKDVDIKLFDINGVSAYRCRFKASVGDFDLDSVCYAFKHKDRMLMINVNMAPGALDVDRYDKVARSIKFKD